MNHRDAAIAEAAEVLPILRAEQPDQRDLTHLRVVVRYSPSAEQGLPNLTRWMREHSHQGQGWLAREAARTL